MDVPVAPPQEGGWSQPIVYHNVNLLWSVVTKRGSQILRVDRLSQEEVAKFDANKEWSKR